MRPKEKFRPARRKKTLNTTIKLVRADFRIFFKKLESKLFVSTSTRTMKYSIFFASVAGIASQNNAFSTVHAFVPLHPTKTVTTRKMLVSDAAPETLQEMTNARFAFWMSFYAAAGVGSIGRELIPIVFGRYQSTNSLSVGEEKRMNNEANSNRSINNNRIDASSGVDLRIWGYPEKIFTHDVEMILKNPLTPTQIAKRYPISTAGRYNYTHMKGDDIPFLGYDSFVKANPNANPVALRAVFDR